MSSYVIGLYEKAMPSSLSWREKLKCAKELGYDFIEISIDESDSKLDRLEWTKQQRREMCDAMIDVGLPIRSMCLSGHRKYPLGSSSPVTRARGLEIMDKAIELASDLGIRIIQLAGYDVYYEQGTEETRAYFAENLHKAVLMASKAGVLMGFETMETDFMNTVEKAMKYVKGEDSPYLGVYPDCGNLTNAALGGHMTVEQDLETGRGHIVAMHLKETVPGKFREIPFFTGHVDFPAVISKAWQLGVRRFVTEMWDVGKADWKEDIKFAISKMRVLLDKQDI